MTTLREAAQQALEALEYRDGDGADQWKADVITALRAALAQEQAEPVQEPAAVVGTQVDVWRGCDGRWAPPGEPIKTALLLKDAPVGTMLYAAPPKRQPLTEQVDLSRCPQCNGPADNGHDRSIPPNPYLCTKCMAEPVAGIIEPRIKGDSHQTLDDAMQQTRAMAQAYESGYSAGVANEREACAKVCESRFMGDMTREDMEARRCAAAIRARGEQS